MEVIMRQLFGVILLSIPCLAAAPAEDPRRAREPSLETWIAQLHAKDPEKVCAAARAIGRLGSAGRAAVPALKELLKERDCRVRLAIAEALWRLEHQGKE